MTVFQLRTVREATRTGGSGFIHVGAFCDYGHFGASHINFEGQTIIYTDSPQEETGTKAAYIISSDGQRIYGKDFYSCLSDDSGVGLDATLTLSFDVCAFFENVVNLSSVSTASSSEASQTPTIEQPRSQKQLVLVCSSQAGQVSGTVYEPASPNALFGASPYLMTEHLKRSVQSKSYAKVLPSPQDIPSRDLCDYFPVRRD
ncbi:hypothetical protein FRC01_011762 [Tulasnella sp. 417]|nr:hypothetical protein FRC01_011762 [Tulasnella sp. 417]